MHTHTRSQNTHTHTHQEESARMRKAHKVKAPSDKQIADVEKFASEVSCLINLVQ